MCGEPLCPKCKVPLVRKCATLRVRVGDRKDQGAPVYSEVPDVPILFCEACAYQPHDPILELLREEATNRGRLQEEIEEADWLLFLMGVPEEEDHKPGEKRSFAERLELLRNRIYSEVDENLVRLCGPLPEHYTERFADTRDVISDWWNDGLRKYWRICMEDAAERNDVLEALAVAIDRHAIRPMKERLEARTDRLYEILLRIEKACDVIYDYAPEADKTMTLIAGIRCLITSVYPKWARPDAKKESA